MKIFIVGDFYKNVGPSIVNKNLRRFAPEGVIFSLQQDKVGRIIELIYKITKSHIIIFSGISRVNILGMKLAKLMRKQSIYLMHGSYENENKINKKEDKKGVELEKDIIKRADKIICVSKLFMNWCHSRYPEFKSKIFYINNGIELPKDKKCVKIKRNENQIMCIGGGMPLKNIKSVCEAIEYINKTTINNFSLLVIGEEGNDSKIINNFDFVESINHVNHEDIYKYFCRVNLYIQNSIFETFGIAPMESLGYGCNLLISNNVGCKGLMKNIEDKDIIFDTNNINEIAKKIICIINEGNNKKLVDSIDLEEAHWRNWFNKFMDIVKDA